MSAQSLGSRAILGELFFRLEQGAAGWVNQLSFTVDSDQASEEHRWLGMPPTMREWVGGRNAKGLRDFGIVIPNKEYEATIEVGVPEIRRDKTQQVMARVRGLADRTNSFGAKLLSTLIIDGESSVCYDGQFFFDTDHSEGDSGTQSNDLSVDINGLPVTQKGSTTAPSADSMAYAILEAVQAMYGFKDDVGEPLNEGARSFQVMVPTPYFSPAVAAMSRANLTQGGVNPLAALRDNNNISIEVVANPRLSWTTKFAVFRADGMNAGVAPFIRQEELPVQVSFQAEGSAEEFDNNRHVYGTNWSGAFGYGFWQHAVLVTLTDSA